MNVDTYDLIAGLKPAANGANQKNDGDRMSHVKVTVRFDGDVPDDVQAKALFDFEVSMRQMSGLDVRVFKERMADDSRLRVLTDARRAKK